MRQTRFMRGGLGILLTGMVVGSSGCTHNYYYGYAPTGCAPTVVPGSTTAGAVCEVPSQVSGGTVAQGSTRSTVVSGTPNSLSARPPRVVVSEPVGRRLGWRPADPDSGLATTRVEGALEDPTTTR